MKRFIKEYANYRIKGIKSNKLMQEDIKNGALARIETVLKYSERGLLTVGEAMQSISSPFNKIIMK